MASVGSRSTGRGRSSHARRPGPRYTRPCIWSGASDGDDSPAESVGVTSARALFDSSADCILKRNACRRTRLCPVWHSTDGSPSPRQPSRQDEQPSCDEQRAEDGLVAARQPEGQVDVEVGRALLGVAGSQPGQRTRAPIRREDDALDQHHAGHGRAHRYRPRAPAMGIATMHPATTNQTAVCSSLRRRDVRSGDAVRRGAGLRRSCRSWVPTPSGAPVHPCPTRGGFATRDSRRDTAGDGGAARARSTR